MSLLGCRDSVSTLLAELLASLRLLVFKKVCIVRSVSCISSVTVIFVGVFDNCTLVLALGVEHRAGGLQLLELFCETLGEAGLSVLSPDLFTNTCTGSE